MYRLYDNQITTFDLLRGAIPYPKHSFENVGRHIVTHAQKLNVLLYTGKSQSRGRMFGSWISSHHPGLQPLQFPYMELSLLGSSPRMYIKFPVIAGNGIGKV
jgi:hypothetical protein